MLRNLLEDLLDGLLSGRNRKLCHRRGLRHAFRAGRCSSGSGTARNWAAGSLNTRMPWSPASFRKTRLASPASGFRANGPCRCPTTTVDVLRRAVPAAVADAGIDPAAVVGIATEVLNGLHHGTRQGRRHTAERASRIRQRPHAYVKLWRHHAAQPQADRINALVVAELGGEPWLPRYGGLISSEWEFAKGLQLLEEDPEIYAAMDRWVEAADWIVWQLCGNYVRNACTAGYKGIYQDGRYPIQGIPVRPEPGLRRISSAPSWRTPIGRLGDAAGDLTAEAAAWTGLPEGIAVAVGNVDAHVTAPAAKAVEPGQLVAIMGTSTCHVMNGAELRRSPGHVRRGGRRNRRRTLGLRSWPKRSRRHLRLVRRTTGVPARVPPGRGSGRPGHPRIPDGTGLPPSRSANTASLPWTGTPATVPCSWTTNSPASWWARPSPPGPRTPTGPCWRPRPSARAPSSTPSATRECRSRSSSWPAAC